MKNLTIGRRIIFGTGVLCLIIIGLSAFSIIRMHGLNRISDSIVLDALPGLTEAAAFNSSQAEEMIRYYALVESKSETERKSIREQITNYDQQTTQSIGRYEKSIFDETVDRKNFQNLMATREKYNALCAVFSGIAETNRAAAGEYLNSTVMPAYALYSHAGDVLGEYNAKNGDDRGKSLTAEVGTNTRILITTGALGLAIGIAGSFLIVSTVNKALRLIASQISDGANQTVSAASQITSASQTLAEGASEQAASLEETSSSLEEMTSMVRRNADSAQTAKDLSSQTSGAADAGAGDMERMQQSMAAIKTSSDDVAKIVKNIDEIAFQTNILALNAAVEAARAGEAGAGFAVVADEVRNLAQRSAKAAKETAEKIEDAINKTTMGVEVSGKVAGSLKQIIEKTRAMDTLVGEIAAACREQAQGLSQINTAVSQMDKVTQSNAASAEETASAAEELNAQSAAQQQSIVGLLALVGSREGSVKTPASQQNKGPRIKKAAIPMPQPGATPRSNGHHSVTPAAAPVTRELQPMETF